MSQYLYRFRRASRLIGKPGEPGELEKLQIYFASPQELNDPLEGYKDFVWGGDEILWRNLIRHYVRCLTRSCVVYALVEPEAADSVKSFFDIHVYPDDKIKEADELRKLIESKLFSIEPINKYIRCLGDGREVRKWELLTHLRSMHGVIITVIFDVMVEEGLFTKSPLSFSEVEKHNTIALLDQLTEHYSGASSPSSQEYYAKEAVRTAQANLISHRKKWDKDFYFILFEFPEVFVERIKEITHPNWYAACFMSECSNSSIWGTYGHNHQGICLKFSVPVDAQGKRSLSLHRVVGKGTNGYIWGCGRQEFYKVDYEKNFLKVDFFLNLGSLSRDIIDAHWHSDENGVRSSRAPEVDEREWREKYWEDFVHSATVKLKDWQSENEYRLIMHDFVIGLEEISLRQVSYDFEALDGVIFGISTPTDEKAQIIEIVTRLCEQNGRKDFNFYQAVYDPAQRNIQHVKLDIDMVFPLFLNNESNK